MQSQGKNKTVKKVGECHVNRVTQGKETFEKVKKAEESRRKGHGTTGKKSIAG